MPSSQKTVVQDWSPLCVGDKVCVRDKPNSSWLKGEVTSLDPVEVHVEGWPIPMSFQFLKRQEKAKITVRVDNLTVAHGKTMKFKWINYSDIPHLLGKKGKRINRIKKEFKNCRFNIIDHKTVSFDLEAEKRLEKREKYWRRYRPGSTAFSYSMALVQVISTTSKQEADKAFEELFKFRIELYRWHSRYRAYLYWKLHQHDNDFDSKKESWAYNHEQWFLQKEQHGANGQWFTRKFKNKGRDRGNRKCRKSSKQTQQKKLRKTGKQLRQKNLRKTGKREKSIRDISTCRRFSF